MKITKAIIPAAGFGTRLLPATAATPKEMLSIVDKPVIQYVVEEAVDSGIKDIYIITSEGKQAIENHFAPSKKLLEKLAEHNEQDLIADLLQISKKARLHYIFQKEQLGLGHAILCAEKEINNEPFVIMNGDAILRSNNNTPVTKQLINTYDKYQKSVVAVEKLGKDKISNYGVIKPKEKISNSVYKVEDLIEKPEPSEAPSDMGICSRYVLEPAIFEMIKNTKPGKKGEIQLTDAMINLAKDNRLNACVVNGQRYDIGNKTDFIIANLAYGLRDDQSKEKLKEVLKKVCTKLR